MIPPDPPHRVRVYAGSRLPEELRELVRSNEVVHTLSMSHGGVKLQGKCLKSVTRILLPRTAT